MNKIAEQQLKEQLTNLVEELDKNFIKFMIQSKLNNKGNTWVYQQIKNKIEESPKEIKSLLMQWLDSRLGDYKLY